MSTTADYIKWALSGDAASLELHCLQIDHASLGTPERFVNIPGSDPLTLTAEDGAAIEWTPLVMELSPPTLGNTEQTFSALLPLSAPRSEYPDRYLYDWLSTLTLSELLEPVEIEHVVYLSTDTTSPALARTSYKCSRCMASADGLLFQSEARNFGNVPCGTIYDLDHWPQLTNSSF